MQEYRLEEVRDFLNYRQVQEIEGHVFRGQAKYRWELKPVLLRHLETLGLGENLRAARVLEDEALRDFKRPAHHYLAANEYVRMVNQWDLSWWTHMRHWQAPTRLLDWTRSFWVALYFACIDDWDSDGAVWEMDSILVDDAVKRKGRSLPNPPEWAGKELIDRRQEWLYDQANPSVVALIDTEIQSERMVVQQGVFSVCSNVLKEHSAVLLHLAPAAITKWCISKENKPELLRELRQMNITARSLFPGPDGHGKAVDELIRLKRVSNRNPSKNV